MANVKLPSGKVVKIPDGMTEKQAIEYIFEKLDGVKGYEKDRELLGDKLDTSGWGSTIGGTVGGIIGAGVGTLLSPTLIANPITVGAAGGAGGAALGEWVEQLFTDKGELSDIGSSAITGGVLGGIGGGTLGAVAKFGAKGGAAIGGAAGAAEGAREGGVPGALIGAGTGAVTGGLTGGAIGKGVGALTKKFGLDKPAKSIAQSTKDAVKGYAQAKWLEVTGRGTAGALTRAKANWDFRRDVARKAYQEAINLFRKKFGKKPTGADLVNIRKNSNKIADDFAKEYKADKGLREKLQKEINPSKPFKPHVKTDPKTGRRYYEDEIGNKFDFDTNKQIGKSYAEGGLVHPSFAPISREEKARAEEVIGKHSGAVTDIVTDFIPGVGEAKSVIDVSESIEEGNYSMAGLHAIAGLAGLIPIVGDAAKYAIKAGAKHIPQKLVNKVARALEKGDTPALREMLDSGELDSVGRATSQKLDEILPDEVLESSFSKTEPNFGDLPEGKVKQWLTDTELVEDAAIPNWKPTKVDAEGRPLEGPLGEYQKKHYPGMQGPEAGVEIMDHSGVTGINDNLPLNKRYGYSPARDEKFIRAIRRERPGLEKSKKAEIDALLNDIKAFGEHKKKLPKQQPIETSPLFGGMLERKYGGII